jgi:peptidyl-prolyl cis-trans isomerase SurA
MFKFSIIADRLTAKNSPVRSELSQMRGFKIFFIAVFVTTFWQVSAMPVPAEICNRVVAIVNNEVITLHELNGKIRQLSGVEPSLLEAQNKEGYLDARRKVLDLLIDETIAHDKINEIGIEVTQKELEAAVERIKERNQLTHEDLISGLAGQGLTYEQYLENFKKEMEQMRLIDFEVKSKIIIREESIKQYYDDHGYEFRSHEKVRLAIIILKNENPEGPIAPSLSMKAEEIVTRIKAGEDFGDLARRYSQGPGAAEGGDLGFFNPAQLDTDLRETIETMAVGEVSGPIVSPAGIQIIKVLEKQETGVKTLEEVRDAIYDALYKEEINKRFSSWIKGLREQAYIKIIF